MGEIIPFPVLKTNFETLGTNEKHFIKKFFDQRGLPIPLKIRKANGQ